MNRNELKELLEDLGLTPLEAIAYVELSQHGPSTAWILKAATGMHKATAYVTLASLMKKGLVSSVLKGRARVFTAAKPDLILEQLKEREKRFKEAMPTLNIAIRPTAEITVFEGKEGLKAIFRDVLRSKTYEHLVVGLNPYQILGSFFSQFQKEKTARMIKSRILISRKAEQAAINETRGTVRYLPNNYASPVSTIIYGSKVAILIWPARMGVVVDNKDTSKAYLAYFETLWKIAGL